MRAIKRFCEQSFAKGLHIWSLCPFIRSAFIWQLFSHKSCSLSLTLRELSYFQNENTLSKHLRGKALERKKSIFEWELEKKLLWTRLNLEWAPPRKSETWKRIVWSGTCEHGKDVGDDDDDDDDEDIQSWWWWWWWQFQLQWSTLLWWSRVSDLGRCQYCEVGLSLNGNHLPNC